MWRLLEGSIYSIGIELAAAFIQVYNLTSAFNAGVLVSVMQPLNKGRWQCQDCARIPQGLKRELTRCGHYNCEDADEDSDCDDNEEIDI